MDWVWAAEAGAENGGGGYWQLAMVLAGIGLLGLIARWRRFRAPPPVDSRELRRRDLEPDRYRDAADKAIVELLETSRSLNAQVDTKIRMLNRLVKDAEECCTRLEKLLAEARVADGTERNDAAASGAGEMGGASVPGPEFRSELHERICRLRDEGRSLAEIAKATSLSITEVKFAIESMNG